MKIYPAIDLKDGKCVRLEQGKFDKSTVFSENPAEVATGFVECGAEYIHVVDLDGARFGSAHNSESLKRIIDAAGIPVQTGGGIRTMRDVEEKLSIGVSRVILGTAAIKDQDFVKLALKEYGGKIAIGIDAINGMTAVSGWEEVSAVSAHELCQIMRDMGAKTIIYTDISKDGMMSGPNIEATKAIIDAFDMDIIASGGVSDIKDIENIKGIGASGAIIGKAIYNGAINLREVIEYARQH